MSTNSIFRVGDIVYSPRWGNVGLPLEANDDNVYPLRVMAGKFYVSFTKEGMPYLNWHKELSFTPWTPEKGGFSQDRKDIKPVAPPQGTVVYCYNGYSQTWEILFSLGVFSNGNLSASNRKDEFGQVRHFSKWSLENPLI